MRRSVVAHSYKHAEHFYVSMSIRSMFSAVTMLDRTEIPCVLGQGLPYELVKLDLVAKGQKDPRFIEMHPFGKVPV